MSSTSGSRLPAPRGDTGAGAYRALLSLPGAVAFFTTAGAGRVGIAMTSLGLVWLVQQHTGSYATAGAVTAAFAVAEAVLGPQPARLVDRHGQTRVLPLQVAAHAAAVTALLLALHLQQPGWVLAACGALMGATIPQLGALSTARWAALLRTAPCTRGRPEGGPPRSTGAQPPALAAAFSLESLANATAYLVGPVLVSVLAGGAGPAVGSGVAAFLVTASGLGLAAQPRTAPPHTAPPRSGPRPRRGREGRRLRSPAFVVLVGVNLAVGAHFGAVPVAVAALGAREDAPQLAGLLLAVSGTAGLLGGWLHGSRRRRTPPQRQLPLLGAALTVACLLMTQAGPPWQAGAALALAGLLVPPILVLGTVLTEAAVPPGVLTQAMVWLNSAGAAGGAIATGVAGYAVDAAGVPAGFAVAAAAAAVMTLLALAGRPALTRPRT